MTFPLNQQIWRLTAASALMGLALGLIACSAKVPIVGDLAIHPVDDQSRPCAEIAQDMSDIEKRALALVKPDSNGEVIRQSATGFGTIIIWPVLETLVGAEDQDVLRELKSSHEALEREAEAAECFGPKTGRERDREHDDGHY